MHNLLDLICSPVPIQPVPLRAPVLRHLPLPTAGPPNRAAPTTRAWEGGMYNYEQHGTMTPRGPDEAGGQGREGQGAPAITPLLRAARRGEVRGYDPRLSHEERLAPGTAICRCIGNIVCGYH